MLNPGDIISEYDFIEQNARGHIYVEDSRNNLILVKGDNGGLVDRKEIDKIKNHQNIALLLISSEKVYEDSQKHFEATYVRHYALKEIIKYYFSDDGFPYGMKAKADVWIDRFGEASRPSNFSRLKIHQCCGFKIPKEIRKLEKDFRLLELPGKWIHMMLVSQRWADDLEHNCFFPNEQACSSRSTAVYDLSITTPARLKAKLVKDNTEKNITIIFHGFIDPRNLHHHVWKHLDDLTPNNAILSDQESQIWRHILPHLHPRPGKVEYHNRCRVDIKRDKDGNLKTRCAPCDPTLFSNVHYQLKGRASSYTQSAVTSFLNLQTYREVKVTKGTKSFTTFDISCAQRIKHPPALQNTYAFLGLQGISYNFNDEEPVIHTFIKTHFRDRANQSKYTAIKYSVLRGRSINDVTRDTT